MNVIGHFRDRSLNHICTEYGWGICPGQGSRFHKWRPFCAPLLNTQYTRTYDICDINVNSNICWFAAGTNFFLFSIPWTPNQYFCAVLWERMAHKFVSMHDQRDVEYTAIHFTYMVPGNKICAYSGCSTRRKSFARFGGLRLNRGHFGRCAQTSLS